MQQISYNLEHIFEKQRKVSFLSIFIKWEKTQLFLIVNEQELSFLIFLFGQIHT